MNSIKHMEALFGVLAAAALLVAALPERSARAAARPAPVSAVGSLTAAIPVVVVKAKRMSAREKRRAALVASAVAAPERNQAQGDPGTACAPTAPSPPCRPAWVP